jgi:hypothetical protein
MRRRRFGHDLVRAADADWNNKRRVCSVRAPLRYLTVVGVLTPISLNTTSAFVFMQPGHQRGHTRSDHLVQMLKPAKKNRAKQKTIGWGGPRARSATDSLQLEAAKATNRQQPAE